VNIDLKNPDQTHVLNMTSTLSSLLGLPVPFSNIGSVIPQTYIFESSQYCTTFYRNLALKYNNTLAQLLKYREKYFHEHDYEGKLSILTNRAYQHQEE